MKLRTNRLIATVLAIVMLVGLLPLTAFAAGEEIITSFNITWDIANPAAGQPVYRDTSTISINCENVTLPLGFSSYWQYDSSGKNNEPNYFFADFDDNSKVFAEGTVYWVVIRVNPNTGYNLSEANASSYTFNGKQPVKVQNWGGTYGMSFYYQFPISSLAKQPTPDADFWADGYDSGELTGVKSGMKYSLDGGTTWTLIEGTSVSIASGVTPENDIKVYLPGVAEVSTDSDIQAIDITRSVVTGVSVVQPTTIGGEGTILGMDSTMRYKSESGAYWYSGESPCNVSSLKTVLVRVEADGTALESEIASFTIAFEASKEATPTEVSFNATDDDKGVLTGVSAGLRYSINGYSYTNITSADNVSLTSLSAGDVITVWRLGNGTTTVDSDKVTFALTKAATPTGIGTVKPTTAANNDGKITGVDSTMEYSEYSGAEVWTAITGTEATGLTNNSYKVRVKGSGTVLASDNAVVTVAAYVALTKEATPTTAKFLAQGASEGWIWDMPSSATYEWYTSLDSTKHTATPVDSGSGVHGYVINVTELTDACTIYLVRKGDGVTTSDSDPKEITVGKATLTKEDIFDNITAWPYAVLSNGTISFSFFCEKWDSETSAWVGKSTTFSFELGDSLTFRKCANGNELASDSVTVTMYPQTAKAGEVSLSLTQSFKFNYYVTMTPAEVAAANVVITFRGYTYSATPTTTGFVFEEVTPQYLGETVNAKLYIGDVVAYEVSCSVKTYLAAVTAADPTNAELQTLANDILVYGGAAQNYVGYKTGELVSEGVTGTAFVPLSSRTPTLTDNGTYVTFTSATVRFDNSVHLKIKFTDNTVLGGLWLAYNDSEVELVSDGEKKYVVTTPAIYASDITSDATFQAKMGGSSTGATLTYGIGHYVYAMQDREDTMGDLARALWNYGLAASAYAASLEA